MVDEIKFRRGTTAQWAASNEVLGRGTPGAEIVANGPNRLKIGDGTTPWADLPYVDGGVNSDLQALTDIAAAHYAATTGVHGISDTDELLVSGDIGTAVQAHSDVLDATTAPFTTSGEAKLAGVTPIRQFLPGSYYYATGMEGWNTGSPSTNVPNSNGYIALVPWLDDQGGVFDQVAIAVSVAGDAGSVIRLGAYDNDGGVPGALLTEFGTVPADSTGDKFITIDFRPTSRFWLAAVWQGLSTINPQWRTHTTPGLAHPQNLPNGNNWFTYFRAVTSLSSGSFPETIPGLTFSLNASPRIALRASA